MKTILLLTTIAFFLLLSATGCKKCYDCTKKCGVCTLGNTIVAGCQGDTSLQGYSVEAWKSHFESLGYTCNYNNTVESVCGEDNKEELSGKYYECISK